MTLKMPGKRQSAQAAIITNDEDIAKDSRSPQDEYVNDILVSLKELQAGEVIDAAESMREIRRELGVNADKGHSYETIPVAPKAAGAQIPFGVNGG